MASSRFRATPPRTEESIRTGLSADSLRLAVLDNLAYMQARAPEVATPHDWYMALAYSVHDRLLARWVETASSYTRRDVKVACYLSAEFLIGP
ncbi:MAG: glycogen phosphorylase, partial [Povalibacter sp.]